MAKHKEINWISENEAAALMGYSPKVFRRYVREGRILGINYVRLNACTYEYNKADIDEYKLRHSTISA